MPDDTLPKPDFKRATVTIPAELTEFANQRAHEPQHAGNFSSYVRSLIIHDKEEAEKRRKQEVGA